MKNFINKYISKIKEFLNGYISLSFKWSALALAIVLGLSYISYCSGSLHGLSNLVEQKAIAEVEKINHANSELQEDINSLSKQKDELNSVLSDKANAKNSMDKYYTDKTEYTEKISQLNTDIGNLDTSIHQKQNDLDKKIAAKEEERRIAAEKAAAEAAAAKQAQMVWIGETGTKYHRQSCRTLRGNKYQITLDEAKAQGRAACKVCH